MGWRSAVDSPIPERDGCSVCIARPHPPHYLMPVGPDKIVIRGARVHNLKNINVDIPRAKLTVITGLSGSGKSSLAFDTIYAEGHRRYVESLSAYARQFLEQMEKDRKSTRLNSSHSAKSRMTSSA